MQSVTDTERTKYANLWRDMPEYGETSPGLSNAYHFMQIMKPDFGETLLDIGCGTGIAGLDFKNRYGLEVCWMDITDAGLDAEISRDNFVCAPLWSDWPTRWSSDFDFGYAVGVMEHLPTEFAMLAADRILSCCRKTWFQISLVPDVQGAALIGQPLHLTVKPFGWWLDRLRVLGNVVDARDLCECGLYIVEQIQ